MKLTSKEIQLQFDGFLNTLSLWKSNVMFGLQQFEIEQKTAVFDLEINPKIRLGKYIERFVAFQLQQEKSIEIIAENIQIQHNNRTVGELDCLLVRNQKPIHLEIVYKFYLYNESVGTTEIEHFIGPNKKNSLIEKLNKLQEKQLPLLYSKYCKPYLAKYNLMENKIIQQVYFKAQLFVPYQNQHIKLDKINSDCIVGFYINKNELALFKNCKFYIPNKKNWLILPHKNVNWIDFNQFEIAAINYFDRQFSPLIWIKNKNGLINKAFLVWW